MVGEEVTNFQARLLSEETGSPFISQVEPGVVGEPAASQPFLFWALCVYFITRLVTVLPASSPLLPTERSITFGFYERLIRLCVQAQEI